MSNHSSMTNIGLIAPSVQVKPKEIVTHNHNRIDNYYWLNDPKNPDVIAYLNEENEYLDKTNYICNIIFWIKNLKINIIISHFLKSLLPAYIFKIDELIYPILFNSFNNKMMLSG